MARDVETERGHERSSSCVYKQRTQQLTEQVAGKFHAEVLHAASPAVWGRFGEKLGVYAPSHVQRQCFDLRSFGSAEGDKR